MLDVAIIGCGVIGAAAAYELSHYPLQTAIFEAENDVADCTTKANSAILHAGYDPEPGTRMARLNVEGVALAKEICARLDVPYRQCGSLVLALSPEELPHLQKLMVRHIQTGTDLLGQCRALHVEPCHLGARFGIVSGVQNSTVGLGRAVCHIVFRLKDRGLQPVV